MLDGRLQSGFNAVTDMSTSSATLAKRARAIRSLPEPEQARAIRLAAGVSMVEMAEALGVHRVTVHRWESGDRRPQGDLAARYARLLQGLAREVA